MVRLVMPENLPPPPEVGKQQAGKMRQIVLYLFYILFLGLCLAGLWYAQASGYLDFNQFTKSL